MALTKIIATIGPGSEDLSTISNLIKAGANVFRLNLKHNNLDWHQNVIKKIKKAIIETKTTVGILLDFPDLNFQPTLKRLSLATKEEVDFIALSLIKTKKDIENFKKWAQKISFSPTILAKIETKESLKNFDSILEIADGIMVARGDLGEAIPIEEVPYYQKEIIKKCIQKGKPVVTATQMLLSMVNNQKPTRAEVSDVANAILDYTDAIMLSEETAIGKYPIEAVKTMQRIAQFWEQKRPAVPEIELNFEFKDQNSMLSYSAYQLWRSSLSFYQENNIKAFVVITEDGTNVKMLSRFRPNLPILSITCNKKLVDQLCLIYGAHPIYFKEYKNCHLKRNLNEIKKEILLAKKYYNLKKGDKVIFLYSENIEKLGKANVLRMQEII